MNRFVPLHLSTVLQYLCLFVMSLHPLFLALLLDRTRDCSDRCRQEFARLRLRKEGEDKFGSSQPRIRKRSSQGSAVELREGAVGQDPGTSSIDLPDASGLRVLLVEFLPFLLNSLLTLPLLFDPLPIRPFSQNVTKPEILASLRTYFLPLFSPATSVVSVASAPGKIESIEQKFAQAGYTIERRTLPGVVGGDDESGSESGSGSEGSESGSGSEESGSEDGSESGSERSEK